MQFVKFLLYFVFVIFGCLCGYEIAQDTLSLYSGLQPFAQVANTLAFVLLGGLMGVLIVPMIHKGLLSTIDNVSKTFQSLPPASVFMGSIGLLFGLLCSVMLVVILSYIEFPKVPIFGERLKDFINLLGAVFCGYSGAFLFSRLTFVHGLQSLLGLQQSEESAPLYENYYILDTSIIIDGRILGILQADFLPGVIIVPRFILSELQTLADSANDIKRQRGRRGLDLLEKIRQQHELLLSDQDYPNLKGADQKLLKLAREENSTLVTNDYNLQKLASLDETLTLNINQLANALKGIYLPGESIEVTVIRKGKEPRQGVGFLEDGTMVVIEKAQEYIGRRVKATLTSSVQTSAGKMLFSNFEECLVDPQDSQEIPAHLLKKKFKKSREKKAKDET